MAEGRSEMENVGIDLRAFNWGMWRGRRRKGFRQSDLALLVGLPTQTIGRFETLKQWPTDEQAIDIADALEEPVRTLFPSDLKARISSGVPSSVRFAIPLSSLPAIGDESDIKRLMDGIVLTTALTNAITKLKPREQQVLTLRFGLEGKSRTQEAVARKLKVSPARIGQIEANALRRLRRGRGPADLREVYNVLRDT